MTKKYTGKCACGSANIPVIEDGRTRHCPTIIHYRAERLDPMGVLRNRAPVAA